MPYIRVRSNDTGHEFDADPGRVSAHPEWVVVDPALVDVQRSAVHGVKSKPVEKPRKFGTPVSPVEETDLD